MPYKTLKQAMKVVKSRPKHGDILDTDDLAVRWKMEPETLAGYRQKSRLNKDGSPRQGPKFITLGDYNRAPVRYRLEDVKAYENRNREPKEV